VQLAQRRRHGGLHGGLQGVGLRCVGLHEEQVEPRPGALASFTTATAKPLPGAHVTVRDHGR
jgi:hypothetical protein